MTFFANGMLLAGHRNKWCGKTSEPAEGRVGEGEYLMPPYGAVTAVYI
jgi:hypothetical protein